jgi:hypothetical protein
MFPSLPPLPGLGNAPSLPPGFGHPRKTIELEMELRNPIPSLTPQEIRKQNKKDFERDFERDFGRGGQ